MLVSPKRDCPHISQNSFLNLETFKNLNFKTLKCECCSENNELWICISCGKAFCGRFINNHYFTEHFTKDNSHCICISMLDLSVWCYQCMTPGFNDPGSYIESEISSNFVKILSDFKFGDNSNSINKNEINSSLSLTKEQQTQIKYDNFIELLKKDKFKIISFLIGEGINNNKETNKNSLETIFEKTKKNYPELEKINFEDLFSRELFLSNPRILYLFLKEFMASENGLCYPNLNHYFIKYLSEKAFGSFVFTENFDGNEIKCGISSKNIIFTKGCILVGHCDECKQRIDINLINKGIEEEIIVKCEKCGGPCKPNIFLKGEEIYNYFYSKVNNIVNSKLIFIIGSDLSTMPFKDITHIINKNNPWIVVINQKEVGNFKYYDISTKEIFLQGKCEDVIKKIIKDCGWNEQDIINASSNSISKIKYCGLEDFENMVLKEDLDNKNLNLFILSPHFSLIENSSIFLSHLSIFDIEERGTIKKDKETISKILEILTDEQLSPKEKAEKLNLLGVSDLEKRSIGSSMGMVIGDAMGSRYEFEPVEYNKIDLFDMGKTPGGAFKLEPGQWTDDSSMGLCIADSLLVNNGVLDQHDLMRRFIAWEEGGYNNAFRFNEENGLSPRCSVGLGGNISMALYRYFSKKEAETKAGNKETSGNGSIMRNAAIPICFHYDIDLACEMARKQSLTTHQGL